MREIVHVVVDVKYNLKTPTPAAPDDIVNVFAPVRTESCVIPLPNAIVTVFAPAALSTENSNVVPFVAPN
jgi:hypothetical protein